MVSFSNGGSSGDVLNMQSLVNRDMGKYKPRKVSAIRTFPPRCGPVRLPLDVNDEENGAGGTVVVEANDVEKSGMVTEAMTSGVGISETANLTEIVVENSDITERMDVDRVKNPEIGNSEVEIACGLVDSPSHVDEAGLDALVEKVTASAYAVEGQTDEVIDTPVQVEEAESLDALAGQVAMTTLDGLSNDAEELKKDSSEKGVALVQKSSMKEAQPIWLKDKCRRRRVSAVRDFPPHCRPIVIEKSEVDSQASLLRNSSGGALGENLTTSEKECPVEIQEVHVTEETETFSDGAVLTDVVDGSVEDELGPEDKNSNTEKTEPQTASGMGNDETVVCSPDSNDNESPHCDDSFSVVDSHWEVVHGLMAARYCPWRKGEVALNVSDDGTSEGKMRNQKRKSKADAVNSSSPQADRSTGPSKKRAFKDFHDGDGSLQSSTFMDDEDPDADNECPPEITPVSMFRPGDDYSDEGSAEPVGNEVVLFVPGDSDRIAPSPSHCGSSSADEVDREVVHGLTADPEPSGLGKKQKAVSGVRKSARKVRKQDFSWRNKFKAVAKKSIVKGRTPTKKGKGVTLSNDEVESPNAPVSAKAKQFDVRLPPFGPNNHNHGDARNRVRETLRLFHSICRKLLQNEEANSVGEPKQPGKGRIDLQTAKIIKDKGKEVNTGKQIMGQVPGVEVGDEFQYRVELAVVGIHRLYQAGIDWMKHNGKPVAVSIVASGGYADDMENADVLKYSGQGGNIVGKSKTKPEDQKLERGNLALSNSASMGTPVRVVRGWKETKAFDPLDSRPKTVTTYVYDGLYTVEKYWTEKGSHGKSVFMFQLRRNPGQPELAWKELKKSSKFKTRPGVKVTDIAGEKEPFPILAVNILDDEKPPKFDYISKMLYPDWFIPVPPAGCECVGRCADSKRCRCAVRNGGEIPYNRNGAIVEVKHLVYECGPHCKCPPACYNRVTQRGLKFKLEIFKTESRGWGLRSLMSIPSGSFICEYAGELLKDTEAEGRIGNDEYLFDIGQNYSDSSLNPEEQAISVELAEEGGGYTIDAARYGNVGRFINHSCSPNLYAQNVIYDHDDKRMPHVMLFAAENIPPLQELTYHYNYKVDEVCDSDGNVKVKKCYCGSAECTGRMY